MMSSEEKAVIEEICHDEVDVTPGTVVLKAGDVYDRSMVLVEGFMLRTVEDAGKDHIVGLQVPGDFVDLHSFALKRLDHDVVAVGPCRLAFARHADLDRVVQENAHLARVLWFATLLDAAIHREWIVKTKQLRADACAAHLLAEVWARLELVDLARPNGFVSPLTQGHLADICGTTPVHMNRALRSLREAGICEFRRGRLFCEDRAALEEFGRFDPAYLYAGDTLAIQENLPER